MSSEEIIELTQNGKFMVYCKDTHRIYTYNPETKTITYQDLDMWSTTRIGN